MNDLFSFFVRYSRWLVFLCYVVLSCVLLFNNNPYQHHVYMTSANAVSSTVYEMSSEVTSYFNLRDINEDLNKRNAMLEAEIFDLKSKIQYYEDLGLADSLINVPLFRNFDFIVARVINNSVSRPFNYLTINKGENDNIKPQMGVIDQNGVVGVVNVVGAHSARVISLLNPNFKLSCKVKNSDNFGSIYWDGVDPRYAILEELPAHAVYNDKDTVVTSGYSSVFPPGIPIGVIDKNRSKSKEEISVRLLSDFSRLSNVQVVVNYLADELRELEAHDQNTSNTVIK